MTTKTIGMEELRRDTNRVLGSIERSADCYTVTFRNRPRAVLLSVKRFNAMQRELERRREEERVFEKVREAEKAIASGRVVTGKLEEILATI